MEEIKCKEGWFGIMVSVIICRVSEQFHCEYQIELTNKDFEEIRSFVNLRT